MNNSSHIRHIDELGRVVIPARFRKELGLTAESPVSINLQDNSIIIQAATNRCAICGTEENLVSTKDKFLCRSCIDFVVSKADK